MNVPAFIAPFSAECLDAQGVGHVVGGEVQLVGRAFDEGDLGWLIGEFFAVDLNGLGLVGLAGGIYGDGGCERDRKDSAAVISFLCFMSAYSSFGC